MYKISVIIPVYNSEKTIKSSIQSILNQKWDGNFLEDIELILVDDCSTDKSKEIMESFSEKYSNIHVYSTVENSGFPSKPRNIGLEKSDSEYVMFMDSDDEYCDDMCQTLFKTIDQEKADVVACNFYNILKNDCKEGKLSLNVENLKYEKNFIIFDSFNAILSYNIITWNKIFRKSILLKNNIKFSSEYFEDTLFSINFYSKINYMIYLKDYFGVKHFVQENSLSQSPDTNLLINSLRHAINVQNFLGSHINFDEYSNYKFIFARPIIQNYIVRISLLKTTKDMKNCLNELYEFENEISFDNSLDDPLPKFLNSLLLKKQIFLVIFLNKILKIIRKSNFLIKIYRLLTW